MLSGQPTPETAEATESDEAEELFELSPFEVSSEDSSGYTATSTLAGTRIRTDLRDIASPISVVTAEFLEDTAARDNATLLQYTTNTEVGGLQGNFGGFGADQGLSEEGSLLRPNQNTRVRGLDQADNTRNFFLSNIPWNSYNIDRVDIQRGPNSILFGVAGPAGIINAQTKTAILTEDSGELKNELSKHGGVRWSIDYNKVLIEDLLAVRIAGLHSEQKFRQEPAFNNDSRIFGTVSFQPQVLSEDLGGRMRFNANFERGEIEANNPRVLPPWDMISLFFEDRAGDGVNDPIGMDRELFDTFLMESSGFGSASRGLNGTVLDAYLVPAYEAIDGGAINNGGVVTFYRPNESNPFFTSRQAPREFKGAIGPDGEVDGTVSGVPFGSILRPAGGNAYSKNIDRIDTRDGVPSRFPLAQRNYYRDRSLSDPTIFDFYNNLVDGDNKREKSDWTAKNISVSQSVFDDRLSVELVYDSQEYTEGRYGMAWNQPYISIDANKNLQHQLSQYDLVPDPDDPDNMLVDRSTYRVPGFNPDSAGRPYANPMAGAAFAFGGSNSNSTSVIERDTFRATAVAEIEAADFMDRDSRLARILGRHVFTGLYTSEERRNTGTDFLNAAMSFEWANEKGVLTDLDDGTRSVVPIMYLSDPLFGATHSSASGLNLDRTRSIFNPAGTFSIDHFDATWRHPLDPDHPNYVDPGAPAFDFLGEEITQSELPANYVGRVNGPGRVLNAQAGDFSQLVTDYEVDMQTIDSVGFTWQGHLLDGHLVPTVGWREDKGEQFNGAGAKHNGNAATNAVLSKSNPDTKGTTTSWGVVAHVPDNWIENVPAISGLSVFYNEGNNSQVITRYNFDGQLLPNPEANSSDYGVVLRSLEDRLSVKLSRYKTEIANGTLGSGGNAPGLGPNQFYLSQLEAWGTALSVAGIYGHAGLDPNQAWFWNWALADEGFDSTFEDPTSEAFLNHPATAAQKAAIDDFIAGMDQSFFDAYQIPVDVSALQAAHASGDVQEVINVMSGVMEPGNYTTAISSGSGSLINGLPPTGSMDTVSKGYELEVNFMPNRNWNIQLNAAKTDAYRVQLGTQMTDFIDQQWARMQGPAGDLRLWWAGDRGIREYYRDNIISALEFVEDQIGQQLPEMRPYRASLVSNYSFREGTFKGFNIGGAYRWEDETILGYRLKSDNSGLNVNDPIYGPSEDSFDMWIGYRRPLTDRIDWKIQANLRNIGEDVSLVPISVNPDGSPAAQRISEGTTWALTNTFSF